MELSQSIFCELESLKYYLDSIGFGTPYNNYIQLYKEHNYFIPKFQTLLVDISQRPNIYLSLISFFIPMIKQRRMTSFK